jgi:hypothetical protein
MTTKVPTNVLRHVLKGLQENPRFIEMGFNFQISGKLKEYGGYDIINGSASFKLDGDNPMVYYNGEVFDLTSWIDCDISYFDQFEDADMSISITHAVD